MSGTAERLSRVALSRPARCWSSACRRPPNGHRRHAAAFASTSLPASYPAFISIAMVSTATKPSTIFAVLRLMVGIVARSTAHLYSQHAVRTGDGFNDQ